jgi:hypothetical protein
VNGSVFQRGPKWSYKFRVSQRDPATGKYTWVTKGGYDTEREAWKARLRTSGAPAHVRSATLKQRLGNNAQTT